MSDRAAVSPDPGRSAGCGERFRDERQGERETSGPETGDNVDSVKVRPLSGDTCSDQERRSLLITPQLDSLSLNVLSTSTGCPILLKVNSCFEGVFNSCVSVWNLLILFPFAKENDCQFIDRIWRVYFIDPMDQQDLCTLTIRMSLTALK